MARFVLFWFQCFAEVWKDMENKKGGLFWEDDEVFLLISIWADEKIQQQLDTCTRKKALFEKIRKRLKEDFISIEYACVT